jgi:hypothetical protein
VKDETPAHFHPDHAISTWRTACPYGLRYSRSGWPADAPPPAQLPSPLQFLARQQAAADRGRLGRRQGGARAQTQRARAGSGGQLPHRRSRGQGPGPVPPAYSLVPDTEWP